MQREIEIGKKKEKQSKNAKNMIIVYDRLKKTDSDRKLQTKPSVTPGNISGGEYDAGNDPELKKIEIGNYTKPIIIPGGFLILKINDLRQIDNNLEIDEKKQIEKLKQLKIKEQLDQYSNIYYNKIKKDLKIEKI